MIFYTNPIACVIFAICLFLHVPSAFLKNKLSVVCIFVNIALHTALAIALLFIKAELSELATLFMASVALYTVLSSIAYRHQIAKQGRGEGEDDL